MLINSLLGLQYSSLLYALILRNLLSIFIFVFRFCCKMYVSFYFLLRFYSDANFRVSLGSVAFYSIYWTFLVTFQIEFRL